MHQVKLTDPVVPHSDALSAYRLTLKGIFNEHHVMGLATMGDNGPYSTPVFYAVSDDCESLFYMSSISTVHSQHILKDPRVSATIYSDSRDILSLHGIQMSGIVTTLEGSASERAKENYFRRYAMARVGQYLRKDHRLFALKLNTIKIVDNRCGFGTSILLGCEETSTDSGPYLQER